MRSLFLQRFSVHGLKPAIVSNGPQDNYRFGVRGNFDDYDVLRRIGQAKRFECLSDLAGQNLIRPNNTFCVPAKA